MAVRRCGQIALAEKDGEFWSFPFSCRTASRQMGELLKGNPRAITRRVLPAVGIDMATRRRKKNLVYEKNGSVKELTPKEWLSINKGLAMELLSASLFSCLDHPRDVLSYCQLSDDGREPKLYAGGDLADVHVDYGAFLLVVEVSARKKVTGENYRTQTTQAINHAESLSKANALRPVYALVINNGSVDDSHVFREIYDELNSPPPKDEDEPNSPSPKDEDEPNSPPPKDEEDEKKRDFRLIPIWARDFAQIVSTLCQENHAIGLHFDTADLARAFDAIHEHIAIKKKWTKPGWTRAAFLAVLEGKPLPVVIEDEGKDPEQVKPEGTGKQRGVQSAATDGQPDPSSYPLVLTWRNSDGTIGHADRPDGEVPMESALPIEAQAEPNAADPASLPMRNGLSGAFLDFHRLPRMLARAGYLGGREQITDDWAHWLDRYGFEHSHLDPDELPSDVSAANLIAADAWRFVRRMGFIGPRGLTESGRVLADFPALASYRCREALAPILAERVEDLLRGEGGVSILPLLRHAAANLAETTNLWARECPGLLPSEVSEIVHWACVDHQRANELVDNIVSWRDSAMNRYPGPDPAAAAGANAHFHADKVSEFYQGHRWLGENVSMSLAAEQAFCRLLVYCGLLEEAW